jgi:hypothetical protein
VLLEEGSDVLRIFEAPHSDRDAFLAWWADELHRAVRDGVKIVIVGDFGYEYPCHKEWLDGIEEEEWYDNDEGSFRVTILRRLFEAMASGGSLEDDWGETIETMSIIDGAGGLSSSRERDMPTHHQNHDPNSEDKSNIYEDSRSDEDEEPVRELVVKGCGVPEINGRW